MNFINLRCSKFNFANFPFASNSDCFKMDYSNTNFVDFRINFVNINSANSKINFANSKINFTKTKTEGSKINSKYHYTNY